MFLDVFDSIFLVAQPFRWIFSAESFHDKDGISCKKSQLIEICGTKVPVTW